jgi:predicted nucleic acid-binding protein
LNRLVVDASVAAKWLLPPSDEPHINQAVRLIEDYVDRKIQIFVPDLFWVEVGNLLWNAARRGRCTLDHATHALDRITAQKFPTIASLFILRSAFAIANSHGRAVYDCLYVALAEALEVDFVTADEKLANALASKYSIISIGEM